MSLAEAALFVKVVEAGGFSAAARQLRMPKTTISKKIRDLERDLGVRLLNRTTRRVSVTEAGARYYGHCTVALQHMQVAAAEARESQRNPAGEIRVGGPGSLTISLLAPMLVKFLQLNPRYTATLLLGSGPAELSSGRIDVLVSVQSFDKAVHAVRLVDVIEMGLFASPRYLESHGSPSVPADLKSHQTVCLGDTSADAEIIWRLFRGSHRASVKLDNRPRFQANDPVPMRGAIIAGLGIGILAVRFASEGQRAGELVRVLPKWNTEPAELNALYLDGGASSRKTRALLDFAVDWFKAM